MSPVTTLAKVDETELIRGAALGDEAAIRTIMNANNRRLYRLARSVVRDDSEAEDVLQDAYMKAFAAIGEFRQDSALATWLTRIVMNEALQRKRRRTERPAEPDVSSRQSAQVLQFPGSGNSQVDPERAMAQREICTLLERAIDGLPDEYRTVLIARVIEDMSIEDTAMLLELKPETVKTRLHRARGLLRTTLAEHVSSAIGDAFPFAGPRCERLTDRVITGLKNTQ